MKFNIDREELLRGLGRVQAIIERRGTLPILANVLIQTDDAKITLAATDLEVGVVATLPAEVETPGSATLGAKKLFEIIRELDHNEVTLALDDSSRVAIESGSAHFNMLSISPEEYPSLANGEGINFVSLEAGLLASMIDRTIYSTSTDETRYNLNGVFMEGLEDKRVRFVATDGHRMAKIDRSLQQEVGFLDKGIIVPRKGVSEIRKLCDETDGGVEIGLGDGFLIVRRPDLLLTSRLIDGEFPNYRQILPKDHKIRLVIERERLVHAVRRISLMAHERSHGFRFALGDGQLELSASNPDLGEAREAIEVEYTGDPLETGFNARYVLDTLGAMTCKEVVIEMSEELTPTAFRPADDPDEVAVIMPMRN